MAAPAVAAAIIRRERDLVGHFRAVGAVSASAARTPTELGVHERLAWTRLVRRAVIRPAANGRYYLDEPSWEALRRMRRRFAVVIICTVVLAGMALAIWH